VWLALTVPFTALAATGKAARKARPIGGICAHDLKKEKKKNILKRGRVSCMISDIKGQTVYTEHGVGAESEHETKHVPCLASSYAHKYFAILFEERQGLRRILATHAPLTTYCQVNKESGQVSRFRSP